MKNAFLLFVLVLCMAASVGIVFFVASWMMK